MVKDFTVLSSDESKLSMYSCTVSSTGPSSTKKKKKPSVGLNHIIIKHSDYFRNISYPKHP